MTRFKFATPIALAAVLAVFGASGAQAAILTGTLPFSLSDPTLSGAGCVALDVFTNCTTINSTGGTNLAAGTNDFADIAAGALGYTTNPFIYDPATPSPFPGTPFLTFTDPSAGTVRFYLGTFTVTFEDANNLLVAVIVGNGYFLNGTDVTQGSFSLSATRTSQNVSYQAGGTIEALGVTRDTTVPEPASMLLLGTGLVGLGARLRRRAKKA